MFFHGILFYSIDPWVLIIVSPISIVYGCIFVWRTTKVLFCNLMYNFCCFKGIFNPDIVAWSWFSLAENNTSQCFLLPCIMYPRKLEAYINYIRNCQLNKQNTIWDNYHSNNRIDTQHTKHNRNFWITKILLSLSSSVYRQLVHWQQLLFNQRLMRTYLRITLCR